MATASRPKYRLCEILPIVGMAKGSHGHARNARAKGETEGRAAARRAVAGAFEASGGTYGHGRACAQDDGRIGEWTVRSITEEENLVARAAKKKRGHGSYEGEISEAPPNLLRDERGRYLNARRLFALRFSSAFTSMANTPHRRGSRSKACRTP